MLKHTDVRMDSDTQARSLLREWGIWVRENSGRSCSASASVRRFRCRPGKRQAAISEDDARALDALITALRIAAPAAGTVLVLRYAGQETVENVAGRMSLLPVEVELAEARGIQWIVGKLGTVGVPNS